MKSYDFNLGMPRYGLPPKLLLIVRLIIIMLTTCFLQVSAAGYAQRLTYAKKNTTLEEVFQQIEKQTGYQVLYADRKVDDSKTIHVNFKNAELAEVLDYSLKGLDLDYEITGKTIVIKPRDKTFLERVVAALTNTNINCRVVDADGKGLPGASVAVKGKNKKVSTDQNGEFFIRGVEEKDILVVSYVGYQPLEISVKEAVSLGKIVLKEIVGELDEVRLIGYGTTTQRLTTGNTSRITAEDIEKQPVANPLQTLQGRMPGVLVTNGQGLPGTETKIQIRGINSINGNRDPLYIVDGVPFSARVLYTPESSSHSELDNFQSAASFGSFTPFNSISPSDIESIDVLKDADATAIYGARGANGVVLITTKRGKSGTTKFDFNISNGVSRVGRLPKDFLNTPEYLSLEREAAKNDNISIEDNKASFPEFFIFDQNTTTNWVKEVIGNTSHVTNVLGSISGGNNNTVFLLSGNYHKEGTVYPGNLGYRIGGGHLNVDHHSSDDKFFVTITASYTSDQNNSIQIKLPLFILPNYMLYRSNGQLNFDGGTNYLASLQRKSTTKTDNLITNGQISYQIFPGLKFKTSLGFNKISLNGLNISPLSSLNPAYNPVNSVQYADTKSITSNIEPQLDYLKILGNSKLQVFIGGTYQYTSSQGQFIQGENYKDENLFGSLAAAGNINRTSSPAVTSYNQYKYNSLFGRINYNYKDRYIINGNFRRDGSSRFGKGNQFGNFGAVGIAWLFSNEPFLKSILPLLSYGKFRTSYGTVGNEPKSDYAYLQSYKSAGIYQDSPGSVPSRIANPSYQWEVNRKLEIGLETGFLNDKILISSSWFKNRTSNQLLPYFLPGQTGFYGYVYNLPAVVDNTGLELLLTTQNISSKEFKWTTSFNISFINNKLISYPGLEVSPFKNNYKIGESLSIVKGYNFAGVDPQTGLTLVYNINGEKTSDPNENDKIIVGKSIPDYTGGIKNSFTYKGINLDFLFIFSKQEGYMPAYTPGLQGRYMSSEALLRWQKPGDITNVPKASSSIDFNFQQSNHFWGDASYIKLKNLSLSYSVLDKWVNKIGISQCKIYIQGQNILTFTKYKGSDPEVINGGVIIPTLQTLLAGVQLTL